MPRRKTKEDFIKQAKEKHDDKYDYSKVEYINNKTPVTIICKKHGSFQQIPQTHVKGSGCSDCKSDCEIYPKTKKGFIEKAKEIHGSKYNYSNVNYQDIVTSVIIICNIHKSEFTLTPINHIHHTNPPSGCPECKKDKLKLKFIKKAKKIHGDKYNYSKVEYVNNKTPVTLICKEHGPFNKIPLTHTKDQQGCPKCSKNYEPTTKGFIEKAKEIHGNKYDYSKVEYVNSKTNVTIICDKHGEFEQTPGSHINQKSGCIKCGHIKVAENQTKTTIDFIKDAKRIHGDKYDYSKVEYVNSKKKVIIICNKHENDYEFLQTPNNHLRGAGCDKCCGNYTLTTKEFIDKAIQIRGNDKYDYSDVEYKFTFIAVKIFCKKHKVFFTQRPDNHLRGAECPKCSNNMYSNISIEWIDSLLIEKPNLQYVLSEEGEFKIPETNLKADVYDKDTKTIYEFHGDYWHGNPKIFDVNSLFRGINNITRNEKKMGEQFWKTISKEIIIRKKGYNYGCLWESEYKKGNTKIIMSNKFPKFI
jgi:hypothetical protein